LVYTAESDPLCYPVGLPFNAECLIVNMSSRPCSSALQAPSRRYDADPRHRHRTL